MRTYDKIYRTGFKWLICVVIRSIVYVISFNPQNNLYKEDVTIITFIIIPTQSLESKTQDIMSGPFWLCTLGA